MNRDLSWMTGKLGPDEDAAPAASAAAAEPPMEMPAWLKANESIPTGQLGGELPAADLPDWMKSDEPLDELPAWMRTGAAEAAPATPTAAAEPAMPSEDLPDWLKSSAPAEAVPAWMQASAPDAPPAAAKAPVELPDFLQPASAEAIERANQPMELEEEAEPPADAAIETGVPDWIKAMAPDPSTPQLKTEEALPPVDADELPDWLKPAATAGASLAAAGLAAGLLAARPSTPDSTTPEAGQPSAATAPLPAEELPDWLKVAMAEQPVQKSADAPPAPVLHEPEEALPPTTELPDWLKEMTASAPASGLKPAEPVQPSVTPQPEPLSAPQIQAPPTAASSTPPAEPDLSTMDGDDAMRWLEGLAAKQGAAPEELITKPEDRTDTPPAWLAAASSTEAAQTTTPAASDWPAQTTPAEELPLPPADLPAWAQTAEPGPSDTIATWLSDKSVPDWLRKPGEAPAAPPPAWLRAPSEASVETPPPGEPALPDWLKTPAEAEAAPKPVESLPEPLSAPQPTPQPVMTPAEAAKPQPAAPAVEPDLSAMDGDDAMRWLEGLAAKQGAAPEELITKPEDRTDTPPAWLTDASATSFAIDLPAAEPAEAAKPQPAAPATPAVEPDLSTMDGDDAMRWLEGLAAKQGAAPEELITKPEDRTDTPPAWLTEAETHQGPMMPPTGVLPDIFHTAELALPAEPATPQPAAPAVEPDLSAMDGDDAMRWLEGLAAKQGAAPEELITRPEDRTDTPPAWLSEGETRQGPVMPPTGALPDFFHITEPVAEVAAPLPASPAVEPVAAEPDLSTMDGDDAMRWLEGLAAKQGAAPEELITKPEDRTDTPPAWLASAQAEPTGGLTTDVPAWIGGYQSEPVQPTPDWVKTPAPVEPPAAPTSTEPDLSTMDGDDAMRWLEGLAAKQGAAPEELITKPEDRTDTPPAWVAAPTQAPEPEAAEEPAPEPVSGLPDWIKAIAGPDTEETSVSATPASDLPAWLQALAPAETPAPPAEPAKPAAPAPSTPVQSAPAQPAPAQAAPASSDSTQPGESSGERLSRLAEKLAASRRAKDLEVAERLERERAEREAAHREVAERMQERRQRQASGTGPLRTPGTGPLKTPAEAAKPQTSPLPQTAKSAPAKTESPKAAPARPASRPATVPARLQHGRKTRADKSAYAGQEPRDVLGVSRQHLAEADFGAAADGLNHLVQTGQLLPETIVELERATADNPGVAPLFRVLGDAYMKTNQLQKALDAYRQALAQL